jgi:hypothetical protein
MSVVIQAGMEQNNTNAGIYVGAFDFSTNFRYRQPAKMKIFDFNLPFFQNQQ